MTFWKNYCQECGKEIPRVKRAFYGNKYRPVVCSDCSLKSSIAVYGSREAYEAAMWRAVVEERNL